MHAGSYMPPAAESLRSPAVVEQVQLLVAFRISSAGRLTVLKQQHPPSFPRAPEVTADKRLGRVQEVIPLSTKVAP